MAGHARRRPCHQLRWFPAFRHRDLGDGRPVGTINQAASVSAGFECRSIDDKDSRQLHGSLYQERHRTRRSKYFAILFKTPHYPHRGTGFLGTVHEVYLRRQAAIPHLHYLEARLLHVSHDALDGVHAGADGWF